MDSVTRGGILCIAALSGLGMAASVQAANISVSLDSNTAYYLNSATVLAGPNEAATLGSEWDNCYYNTAASDFNVYWGGGGTPTPSGYSLGTISYGAAGSTSTPTYILDSSGAQTNLTVGMQVGFNNNRAQVAGSGTAEDDALFSSGFGGNNSTTAGYSEAVLTLSNIPYAATGYSVYVYFTAGNASTASTGSISDGGTQTYYVSIGDGQLAPFVGYTQGTSTTAGSYTPSDYVVFSNEDASSLTLTANLTTDIEGFQIVPNAVPEPTSLALIAAGIPLLLRRRKRLPA